MTDEKLQALLENIHKLRDNYIKQLRTMLELEWTVRRKALGSTTVYESERLKRRIEHEFKQAIKGVMDANL